MTLLWVEGFEGFGTSTGSAPSPAGVVAGKYPTIGNESSMDVEDGRINGYSIEMPTNSYFGTPTLTTDDTLIAGVGFRTSGGSDYTIIAFFDGSTKNVSVRYKASSSELDIWLDNTLYEVSSGLNLSNDTWYYLEMKVKTHQTTGTYDVLLGGVSVFSDTGIDTQTGSNSWSDNVRFFGAGGTQRWDDIYICDATGSLNNDFLGNSKVVAVFPDGDDTANWGTSTPNASHYANVDENPEDGDTSYVEESTTNLTDLYDYEALPALGDVYGLQINTTCRESDASTFTLITPIESNGTQDDDAGTVIGTTSYVNRYRVSETDPDTANAWTDTAINAAKFGVKVG